MAPGRALALAALLLLPAGPAEAAEGGAPPPADAVAMDRLAAADAALRAEAWADAAAHLDAAAEAARALPLRPPTGPGAELNATLAGARAAAAAGDAGDARAAVARARAGVVHAVLAPQVEDLRPPGASRLSWPSLANVLDLGRAPGLAAAEAALAADPRNATLADRVAQRWLDRVAEEARVALRLAEAASAAGLAGEARAQGAYAGALAEALDGEARRLPPAAKQLWDRHAAALARGEGGDAGRELRPLLLAVGLGRTIVRLDDLGDEVLVGALAWERAVLLARDAPHRDTVRLADAARRHHEARYGEVRRELFLAGEGSVEPLDLNLTRLGGLVDGGASAASLRDAAERVRGDLQRVAHLTFGAFAKLEFVHVPPGQEVAAGLVAGRFPFEGVAAWEARVRWDPAVGRLVRVEVPPNSTLAREARDDASGTLDLRVEAAPPTERGAKLARLTFLGAGAAGQETPLHLERVRLVAADGREPELFLVARGNLFMAIIEEGNATEEDPLALSNPDLKGRRSPGPADAAAFAGLALLALAARRRGR